MYEPERFGDETDMRRVGALGDWDETQAEHDSDSLNDARELEYDPEREAFNTRFNNEIWEQEEA